MSFENIVFTSVSKKFEPYAFGSPIVALDDFSYTFEMAKTTLMLGHNGAGKTTCLKILLGLIAKYQGSISWRGQAIGALQRAGIGYMPENNLLPINLTAGELLRVQYMQHGILIANLKTRIQSDLDAVGLAGMEKRLVKALSKGQLRRLAWALATAHNPDVLVLDEPFSGLDPLGRLEMLDWLREKKADHKTLIFASHEITAVTDLCDQVVVLRHGKKVLSQSMAPSEESMFRIVVDYQAFEQLRKLMVDGLLPSFEFEAVHSFIHLNVLGRKNAQVILKWCIEASVGILEFRPLSWLELRKNLYQLKE